MDLVGRELADNGTNEVGKADGQSVIDNQLLLHAESNQIHQAVIDLPPMVKRYVQEKLVGATCGIEDLVKGD